MQARIFCGLLSHDPVLALGGVPLRNDDLEMAREFVGALLAKSTRYVSWGRPILFFPTAGCQDAARAPHWHCMQFNSYIFIFVFLPLVLGGYLLLRRTKFANAFMLLASLYFYAVGALWYLAPFFVTALIDFFVGQQIEGSDDQTYRKRMLVISVVANLGLLSVFKYTGWLTSDLSLLLAPYGIAFTPIALALPPAISFYTFQSMSYTIDIYRREFKPYRNVIDYLSFVSFFPHLVAGPIMRARDLLPQLARIRSLPSAATVSGAMFMILFGLFQKTVLADNFGGLVESIQRMMANPGAALPPGMGLIFAYAFAFQIYCDFAAYTTIARGVARLFGVDLMRNFLTPYFSTNPSEFWSRWHISLSTWLRDYLYIPLGGNQHGPLLTMRNLMITMLLGGLWHGAGIFFIIWGLYHGLLLVLYRLVPIDEILIRRLGRFGKILVDRHFLSSGLHRLDLFPRDAGAVLANRQLDYGVAGSDARDAWAIPRLLDPGVERPRQYPRVAYGERLGFHRQELDLRRVRLGRDTVHAAGAGSRTISAGGATCEFPDLFEPMPWVGARGRHTGAHLRHHLLRAERGK